MMDVKQITTEWLRKNGYDGLHASSGDYACELDDLMPCGQPEPQCAPGWSGPCDCGEGCDFHIYSDRGKYVDAVQRKAAEEDGE